MRSNTRIYWFVVAITVFSLNPLAAASDGEAQVLAMTATVQQQAEDAEKGESDSVGFESGSYSVNEEDGNAVISVTLSAGAKQLGRQKKGSRRQLLPEEWFVRVIATGDGLRDAGNVLGQLTDSTDGLDRHDLEEKPPHGRPYLTVVFLHPSWGDYGLFASDYHASRPGHKDSWSFVVRSDDAEREVTLSFEGPQDVLDQAQLFDVLTEQAVPLNAYDSYTFVMGAGERQFVWRMQRGPQ